MRKILSIVLSVILVLFISVPAMAAEADTPDINTKGYACGFNFNSGFKDVPIDIRFSYSWLTTGCNSVFNKNLAEFADLLSVDIYGNSYVRREGSTDKDFENETEFLESLGVDDVEFKIINEQQEDYDGTALVMGHKVATVDGKKYNVFFSVVSGTRNKSDWVSNADFGAATEDFSEAAPEYKEMITGDLVDWDNKELHKGFGVAASRTKAAINKYISDHTENDIPSTMLICGHSRGAAIANILGAYYEDRDDIISYTNTFASPLCTVVNKSYKSIFNVVNYDDAVSKVPLGDWGFYRYGTDIGAKISDNPELRGQANKYFPNGYNCVNIIDEILDAISPLAKTRNDFYITRKLPLELEHPIEVPEDITEEDEIREYIEEYILDPLSDDDQYAQLGKALEACNRIGAGLLYNSGMDVTKMFYYRYIKSDNEENIPESPVLSQSVNETVNIEDMDDNTADPVVPEEKPAEVTENELTQAVSLPDNNLPEIDQSQEKEDDSQLNGENVINESDDKISDIPEAMPVEEILTLEEPKPNEQLKATNKYTVELNYKAIFVPTAVTALIGAMDEEGLIGFIVDVIDMINVIAVIGQDTESFAPILEKFINLLDIIKEKGELTLDVATPHMVASTYVIAKNSEAKPTAHVCETRGKISPTYSSPGYSGDVYCKECGILLEKGYEIPPLTPDPEPKPEPSTPQPVPQPTSQPSDNKTPGTAGTGDETNLTTWVIIACVACAAIVLSVVFVRKRQKQN